MVGLAARHDQDPACTEYWLVTEAPREPTRSARAARQWLTQICDHQKWQSFLEVDAVRKTVRYGGHSLFSLDRSFSTTTLGLDPLRVIETNELVLGEQSSEQTWNWDEFAGSVTLGIDYCSGKVPAGVDIPSDSDAPLLQVAAVAVPRVALPGEYLAGGWRTTQLGTCAALVDGVQRGFTVNAGSGAVPHGTLKVVLSKANDLFVEIVDDSPTADPRGFEQGDHLELWLARPEATCVDPKATIAVSEWGIRIADGRAFAGFGPPTRALKTEHIADASGRVRLRIPLAEQLESGDRITIVYVDRDEKKAVLRAIATSELSFAKWWTLGKVTEIDGDASTCTVTQGRLVTSGMIHLPETLRAGQ